MKVLFASSEVWPLIKTGGLGDVSYSLPKALQELGQDVKVILPAYRDVLKGCTNLKILAWMDSPFGYYTPAIRLVEAHHEAFDNPVWLVDCQALFDRPGTPYSNPDGQDWFDNAERYTQFSWAVAQVATGLAIKDWQADVVHANDWQCGLIPAFLDGFHYRPKRIFTIHNLAFGGHFTLQQFKSLKLPDDWWSSEGVEFYGGFSMLKAGLMYSDAITTVSPTYAKEICTPAFGYGMDGILSSRSYKLTGILNGVDEQVWNPSDDKYLPYHYTKQAIQPGKRKNKHALLSEHLDKVSEAMLDAPLFGMVTRLTEQKGVDIITHAIPAMLKQSDANFVLMGSGSAYFERVIQDLRNQYPKRVFCYIGYSETMAHLVEAGSDIFLMPSRYEPCGLNQMYSLRYGTLPIVTNTGGLADTVVDASKQNIAEGKANGFMMHSSDTNALLSTMQRAVDLYEDKSTWLSIQKTAMNGDFSWQVSAEKYLTLYK